MKTVVFSETIEACDLKVDDDDDCFKVAQASRHSGYPLLPNRDSYFSHSCTTTWQPE